MINNSTAKQKLKDIVSLDPGTTLEIMQELQCARETELIKFKQNTEAIFKSAIEELQKLQVKRFAELSKIVDDTCMESEALVKVLVELKQLESLVEFLTAKNYINNYLKQTLILEERQQQRIITTIIGMAKDRKDELTDLMFSLNQEQEAALLELLKIKIINNAEHKEANFNEELELIVKRTKLEYKNTLFKIQATQKQLNEELKSLRNQAEQSHVAVMANMIVEQNNLAQKMDELKKQENTMPLFTKYKALVSSKKSNVESNEQLSSTVRLTY